MEQQLTEHLRKIENFLKEQYPIFGRGEEQEFTIDTILQDIHSISTTLDSFKKKSQRKFNYYFKQKTDFLTLHIFLHLNFFLLIAGKINIHTEEFLHIKKDSYSWKALLHFTFILTNLTNTLISIQRLLRDGMDLQAKILLRSYIEHTDLAVAILADEEFFNKFSAGNASFEEANQIWYKILRPKKMQSQLQLIYLDMDPSGALWNIVSAVRKPAYELLSFYTHGSYVTTAISAIATDFKDEDKITSSIGGAAGINMEYTINHAIIYSNFLLNYTLFSLVEYHKLPMMKFGDEGVYHAYAFKNIDELFRKNSHLFIQASDNEE